MTANTFGFSPDATVIGDTITPAMARQAVIDEFDGANFQALADKYRFNLIDVHKIIFSARPDAYCQSLATQRRASAATPKNYEGWQNTSASPGRARNQRRNGRRHGKHAHSDRSRSDERASASHCASSSKTPAEQTACTVHINVDTPHRICLQVTPANGQALELTFSCGGRSAGKHRSFRD